MKPYYDHAGIVIYHGDCREILPALPLAGFVLASDPPYGIDYRGGRGGNLIHSRAHRKSERIRGDAEPFDPGHLVGLGLPTVLFGAQHYYARLPDGGSFHVWDKRGPYAEFSSADFDTIWVNRRTVGRIFRLVWRGLCRTAEHNERIVHPTQKPRDVMRWALGFHEPGLAVLDPYAGSGTTLLVAKQDGRCAIGIEIEERYCEVAAKRLSQEVLPFATRLEAEERKAAE